MTRLKHQQTQFLTSNPAAPAPPMLSATAGIISGTFLHLLEVDTFPPAQVSAPALAFAAGGDGEALHIDANLQYAFVLSGPTNPTADRLQIFDITIPSAPVTVCASAVVGSTEAGQYTMAVTSDGQVFIAVRVASFVSAPQTMEFFNISTPAVPASIASYNLETDFAVNQGNPTSALLQSDTVLVVAALGEPVAGAILGFYDTTNPAAVTQTTATNLEPAADALFSLLDVQGDFAYTLFRSLILGVSELRIYDISNPALPTLEGSVALPGSMVNGSQLDNGKIYGCAVLAADKNLYVFDVSNPAAPTLASSTLVAVNSNFSIRGANDRAYLASQLNAISNFVVSVFDTTNPAAPALLGTSLPYQVFGGRSNLQLNF